MAPMFQALGSNLRLVSSTGRCSSMLCTAPTSSFITASSLSTLAPSAFDDRAQSAMAPTFRALGAKLRLGSSTGRRSSRLCTAPTSSFITAPCTRWRQSRPRWLLLDRSPPTSPLPVPYTKDYNCTLEFFRSPFPIHEWEMPVRHGKKKETVRLDKIDRSSSRYKNADIIVFNTGHWWTHEKTSLGAIVEFMLPFS